MFAGLQSCDKTCLDTGIIPAIFLDNDICEEDHYSSCLCVSYNVARPIGMIPIDLHAVAMQDAPHNELSDPTF